MTRPLNPNVAATLRSPVPEAIGWLDSIGTPPGLSLLNVSQAAPALPPPVALRHAMAEALLTRPEAHLYGAVLGQSDLRAEVAARWSAEHGAEVGAAQVAITSGCNHAFVAAMATLAGPGDEVILPTPWYFNHKMWLDMAAVRAVPLATGQGMLPDPQAAARLLTERTRAIVLVTPNNPAGVEYTPELIRAFFDLAQNAGVALVLDETYRDFLAGKGAPHDLFALPGWDDTLIQLYSFSKAYRLTGHRVGAMSASVDRLAEVEKVIDTITICPSQIGQIGALWGMRNLAQWLAGERADILDRRLAITQGFPRLAEKGWTCLGLGGFFAYVTFPHDEPADEFARRLLREAGVLALPGTMFAPPGDPGAARQIRIAFANVDRAGIADLFDRLSGLAI